MSVASRLLPRTAKGIGVALVLLVLFGVGAWQGLRLWWYHGFSRGERTGILRKFSYKGSPLCKYWSGEMALVTPTAMGNQEIWEFTVDGPRDNNPLVAAIQKAEAE